MADEQLIKPRELPSATAVFADDAIMTDDGVTVAKATPVQIVDAGAPVPSQSEAIAGVDNSKRMTPLTVRQVLDNTSAPAVLRAQAWAESATTPDPSMPGSKSSRTWALEAAQSASDAEDAASTAATDTANLITETMQGYVDSASGSASAAATSEENAAISAGQAATSAGQAAAAVAGSVRFDQAQTLTSGQKQQARDNIGAAKGITVTPVSAANDVRIYIDFTTPNGEVWRYISGSIVKTASASADYHVQYGFNFISQTCPVVSCGDATSGNMFCMVYNSLAGSMYITARNDDGSVVTNTYRANWSIFGRIL